MVYDNTMEIIHRFGKQKLRVYRTYIVFYWYQVSKNIVPINPRGA